MPTPGRRTVLGRVGAATKAADGGPSARWLWWLNRAMQAAIVTVLLAGLWLPNASVVSNGALLDGRGVGSGVREASD